MAKRYNILTRCLAALALLFVYVASTSAILVGGTTYVGAGVPRRPGGYRGGGGFYRGGGRGFYRGRGYGRGYGFYGAPVVVGPRCWWNAYGSTRLQVVI